MRNSNTPARLLFSLALVACLSLAMSRPAHAISDGDDFELFPGGDVVATILGIVIFVPTNIGFTLYDLAHLKDEKRSETVAFVEVGLMATQTVIWGFGVYNGLLNDNDTAGINFGMGAWSAALFAHGLYTLQSETRGPTTISLGNQEALVAPVFVTTADEAAPGLALFGRF